MTHIVSKIIGISSSKANSVSVVPHRFLIVVCFGPRVSANFKDPNSLFPPKEKPSQNDHIAISFNT